MRLRLLKKRENRVVFLCNFSTLLKADTQTPINRHFFCEDFQQKNVPDDTLLKWVQDTCFHTCKDRFRHSRFRCGSVPVFLSFDIKKSVRNIRMMFSVPQTVTAFLVAGYC